MLWVSGVRVGKGLGEAWGLVRKGLGARLSEHPRTPLVLVGMQWLSARPG